jgi:hypothetical protein
MGTGAPARLPGRWDEPGTCSPRDPGESPAGGQLADLPSAHAPAGSRWGNPAPPRQPGDFIGPRARRPTTGRFSDPRPPRPRGRAHPLRFSWIQLVVSSWCRGRCAPFASMRVGVRMSRREAGAAIRRSSWSSTMRTAGRTRERTRSLRSCSAAARTISCARVRTWGKNTWRGFGEQDSDPVHRIQRSSRRRMEAGFTRPTPWAADPADAHGACAARSRRAR